MGPHHSPGFKLLAHKQHTHIVSNARQLGPYYCFIILFNIYMCIIIYLFKRQLLSFNENELFIK